MYLIIVESPTKSRTISKFLGPNYKVLSSYGHIRDLPKSKLGIDVEKNFEPQYVIPTKARKTITALKEASEKADETILATDEDREGESIAWHLAEVLNLKNPERIVFHEITKSAIREALEHPRKINYDLVDAQQARRILDRLVGYKLSPFLWKKVARGLSAGRVQSVAVRLVVDRENEIKAFKSEEYWSIVATLLKVKSQKSKVKSNEFEAILNKKNGKTIEKLGIKSEKDAKKILEELEDSEYKISEIEKKEIKRNPLPPFTTSTLQQAAWQRFHLPAKSTMRLAQSLYEKGYITYHRTDSLNLSEQSLQMAKSFIEKEYGKDYWAGAFKEYKAKGKAQEAHEAIRPTGIERQGNFANKTEEKLYDLIRTRFLASQMAPAIFDATSIQIQAGKYGFQSNGQIMKFAGFLKVYQIKPRTGAELGAGLVQHRPAAGGAGAGFEEKEMPSLEEGEVVDLVKIDPLQHFTQPPARYSEATLIKALEDYGIGRPSTYAPTLATIQERNYVEKDENKKFRPTEIGQTVNDLLVEHFPRIVDLEFTAKMEEDLDEIENNKREWVPVIKEFYGPFAKNLEQKYEEVSKSEVAIEQTDRKCPECGSPIIIRLGRYGKFYACSNFPKCKFTEPLEKASLNIKCPKCLSADRQDVDGEMVEKRTRRGKIFYGCNKYPECDFALWDRPIDEKCPKCGSLLVETKRKQKKCSNKSCETNKKAVK